MSEETFDQQQYLKKKRREKWQSWFFLLFGLLVLLDSGLAFPVPLVGVPSIIIGTGLLGYGYIQYQAYRKLPLHETLLLGKQSGGNLTRTDVFLAFQLSPKETDEILHILVQEGFIEPVDTDLPPDNEICYRLLS